MHTIEHEKTGEKLGSFRGSPPRVGELLFIDADAELLFRVVSIVHTIVEEHLHSTVKVRQA